jgi:hypothetical protein
MQKRSRGTPEHRKEKDVLFTPRRRAKALFKVGRLNK